MTSIDPNPSREPCALRSLSNEETAGEDANPPASSGAANSVVSRFGGENALLSSPILWRKMMRGETAPPDSLDDETASEAPALEIPRKTEDSDDDLRRVLELMTAYASRQFEKALRIAEDAEHRRESVSEPMIQAAHSMYRALAAAALMRDAPRDDLTAILDAESERLRIWTENLPADTRHKSRLVEAERARIEGDATDAMRLYEEAISSAFDNGFLYDAALANEIAARFYEGVGVSKIALAYSREALDLYRSLSAKTGEERIVTDHPELRRRENPVSALTRENPVSTMLTEASSLDESLESGEETPSVNRIRRENEARLRLALEAAEAGIWEWDLRTQENRWSEETWRLYGLEPGGEASYELWRSIVHPDDFERAEKVVNEAAAVGEEIRLDFRVFNPNGESRWLTSQGRPSFDSEGRPYRYLGIITDVTKRKRFEEALRESRTQLETALSSMTDAVFISDTEGRFIHINDAFATYHRFKNKEECARTLAEYPDFLEVSFADGRPAPLDQWAVPRALRGETVVNAEYHLRRKDTGEAWIGSYNFAPVRDPRGEIIGSVVTGRDVTEIKRSEEALRESEARYRGLFENMVEGFAYCRMIFEDDEPTDFIYLAVNEAFERLTGLRDVEGKRVSEVIPGIQDSDSDLLVRYGRVARSGNPERFEIYVKSLEMWFSISVYSPERGRFVAVFDVITERKRDEERLRSALEEKTALLREVHHRVKNNLQVVIHLLKRRRAQIADEATRDFLAQLENQARTMSLVYEQLFETESIAQVRMQPYLRNLTEGLLQAFGGEREVALSIDAGDLTLIAEQAMPCGLIVNELVANALKHAFPPEFAGPPEIRVEMRRRDDEVILKVGDNGAGGANLLDWRSSPTQGMHLVELWATHQLGGSFDLDARDGVTITIAYDWNVYQR